MKHIKILLLLLTVIAFNNSYSLMLNLKNVDIKTLINTVSMTSGKNFLVDPRVKGTVNLISNKEIDDDQLYQVFLTILKSRGFIVVEGEQVSKILPKNLTKSESAYISSKSTDAIVTKIISLENILAAQIVPIVRPLMSSFGLLSVYIPNNSLVVIDTGSNIARLEGIIDKLDKPFDSDFEFITLKHASATQMASLIKPLFAKKSGLLNITVDKHNNQLIVSGSKDRRLKVRMLVAELDKNQTDAGTTAIIYLKYASAKDILPILQGINQHNVSAKKDTTVIKSNIQANEATNSIIITGDNETKQTIKNIIIKLDVRRAQVLIEAVIAEVALSDAKELGVQWIAKGGAGIGITNLSGSLPAIIASAGGNSSSVSGGLAGGLNFIAGKYDSGKQSGIGVLINALNSTGNTNILSTPSILTLDNNEAEIVVGQEVPFITNKQLSSSGSNPFQNYERKDVGLTLRVTPQINNGSSVKLDIFQEISNVLNSSSAADLITSKRTIKTSVIVEDGKLLVLGGLIDDSWRDNVSKIPVLGNIPLLGKLFTSTTKSKSKRNLMIFIRPTIIKDQILSDEISMQKYDFIKAQHLLNDEASIMQDKNKFLSNIKDSRDATKLANPLNKVTPLVQEPLTSGIDFNSMNNFTKEELPTKVKNLESLKVDSVDLSQTSIKKTPLIKKDSLSVKEIEFNEKDESNTLDGYLDKKLERTKYTPVPNSPYYIGN